MTIQMPMVGCPKSRQTMRIELVCLNCGETLSVIVQNNGWYPSLKEVARAHRWKVLDQVEKENPTALCPKCHD